MIKLAEETPDKFGRVRPSHLIGPRVPGQFHPVVFDSHVTGTIAVDHVLDLLMVV